MATFNDLPLDLQRVIYGKKYRMESVNEKLAYIDYDVGESIDLDFVDWAEAVRFYNSSTSKNEEDSVELIDTFAGWKVIRRFDKDAFLERLRILVKETEEDAASE